jgi:branched-chain amino acid transport system ATP-binding protein
MTPVLAAKDLSLSFGALHAVNNLSFELEPGARHALIGPNGAGKTSFINLLSGTLTPNAGQIYLYGEKITHIPQHQRVKRGLTRTFQITALFPKLTVLETLLLAICEREERGGLLRETLSQQAKEITESLELLSVFHLESERDALTHKLPYGKQRLLEIALALATRPRILLLDEPTAGIPIGESREVLKVISELPSHVSILLIEHDMELVFRFAERISVMVSGSILVEGPPEAISADARVRKAYLGDGIGD